MNKNITKEQIEDCIYLFKNASVRNPAHANVLLNVYSAQLRCNRTYEEIVNAVALDYDAFNNLVKNLNQTIAEANARAEFELLILQNKKRP